MDASTFGEVDKDLEDDFTAVLSPRPRASGEIVQPQPPAKAKPAKKRTQKRSTGPESRKQASTSPVSTEDTPGAPAAADAPSRDRPRRGRPPNTRKQAQTPRGPVAQALVLWTPESIRSRMQAVRGSSGTLYLDLVLDALESTVDELPDLVAAATERPHVQGRLFEREVPAEHTPQELRKQLTIRGITTSQLETIDHLVDTTGAGSRSKLVNLALDAFLPAEHLGSTSDHSAVPET